jgi:anti-sigma-K factor RskA
MFCKECQELLSDYIDGALELGEEVRIEHHLSDCEPCRIVRDDLLQIVHFSHQLPLHSPGKSLWARIEADINENQPKSIWSRARVSLENLKLRNFRLTIPQMAAACAAVIVVTAVSIILSQTPRTQSPELARTNTSTRAQEQMDLLSKPDFDQLEKQIGRLTENVEQQMGGWDPELKLAFDRNMAYVDQSLVECRHQLADNPGDDISQELMLNAYREKVRLLEGCQSF